MKQQLSEALADARYRIEQGGLISPPYVDRTLVALVDVGGLVERLLPGDCPHGKTEPHYNSYDPDRSGSDQCPGRVWDEGIVEAVADVIARSVYNNQITLVNEWQGIKSRAAGRAVLSALVELLTEKVE